MWGCHRRTVGDWRQDLFDLNIVGPGEKHLQAPVGLTGGVSGVDVAQQLACRPRALDLMGEIVGVHAAKDAAVGVGVEPLDGDQKKLVYLVQRVTVAAAMTKGLLLDTGAELIDNLIPEPDQVEVVHDQNHLGQGLDESRLSCRCRVPGHPQVADHMGQIGSITADPADHLVAGPLAQHHPRVDLPGSFPLGGGWTGLVSAALLALLPHQ